MRSNYDDLMGLDMYDDGMSGLLDMGMAREQAVAAGASAASIILAAWALPKLPIPAALNLTEVNQHRARAVVGILAGMLAGRGLWNYNRDAAMAVVGGVSGLALAQLIDTYFDANLLGGGYPLGALPEDSELSAGDEALLSAYGRDNSSALSSLEATNVQASRGAFSEFAGPQVTNEALMGFGSAMVTGETLGRYDGYLA
jgi:hypothetical protein